MYQSPLDYQAEQRHNSRGIVPWLNESSLLSSQYLGSSSKLQQQVRHSPSPKRCVTPRRTLVSPHSGPGLRPTTPTSSHRTGQSPSRTAGSIVYPQSAKKLAPSPVKIFYDDASTDNNSLSNSSSVPNLNDMSGFSYDMYTVQPLFQRTPTPVRTQQVRTSTPTRPQLQSSTTPTREYRSVQIQRTSSPGVTVQRDSSWNMMPSRATMELLRDIPLANYHALIEEFTSLQQQQLQQLESAPTRSTPPNAKETLKKLASTWVSKHHESSQNYREGGYMTLTAGDILDGHYEVIQKLGWGEFSTVWLAYDRNAEPQNAFCALKVARCQASVTTGTKYEIRILTYLQESFQYAMNIPISGLQNIFDHRGQYGTHLCMVMPLLGSNLLCVIDQMKAKKRKRSDAEVAMIKEITATVLVALDNLEKVNVLHTDMKPENILMTSPDDSVSTLISNFLDKKGIAHPLNPHSPIVTVADFGLALLLEPSDTLNGPAKKVGMKKDLRVTSAGVLSNQGITIQTREYRAPEVLLGSDFCCRTDIWSLGCIVYELITGDFLFDPKKKTRVEREMDVEHLANIMQILGPLPNRIAASGRSPFAPKFLHRYFTSSGQFLFSEKYKAYGRRSIATELEEFLDPSEAERSAQFIMSCFTYDPMERSHASDLLKHSWIRATQL